MQFFNAPLLVKPPYIRTEPDFVIQELDIFLVFWLLDKGGVKENNIKLVFFTFKSNFLCK